MVLRNGTEHRPSAKTRTMLVALAIPMVAVGTGASIATANHPGGILGLMISLALVGGPVILAGRLGWVGLSVNSKEIVVRGAFRSWSLKRESVTRCYSVLLLKASPNSPTMLAFESRGRARPVRVLASVDLEYGERKEVAELVRSVGLRVENSDQYLSLG
jgi:hypothetical protein